jgi:hypothetical protein
VSRLFDGQFSVESVTFAVGNAPPDEGPITMAVLFRPQTTFSTATCFLLSGLNGATGIWGLLTDSGKPFTANDFGTGGPTLTGNVWYWLVATKATGAAIPRFHVKDITNASAWVHQDDSSNVADGTGPITKIVVGSNDSSGSSDMRGELVAAAAWTAALTDLQVEAACTLNASDLSTAAPNWGTLWNQGSTATSVTDFTGGGGDQTAITGTACRRTSRPAGPTP